MIRVIFFATPQISIKSLDYLVNSSSIDVIAVVTQPDKPCGRGHKITSSPVKKYALEHNIAIFQPKSIRKEFDIQDKLKELKPDYFVTFAFGQILSREVLDIPKFETINLHASLLPLYRGANPIQCSLINGDLKTGICTMITEEGLDCGDVCLKKEIEISENMNFETLHDIISELSPQLIEKTLVGLSEKTINPVKQDNDCATCAPKIKKEDTKIDWNKKAEEIHNLVRGIYKSPSASCVFKGKLIKVLETRLTDCDINAKPGEVLKVSKLGVEIATGLKSIILTKLKPEGKSEMLARDWANGVKPEIGELFE